MNQKLELCLEATIDDRTYRLMLPIGAPFEHVFQLLESFKDQVTTMQTISQQQAAQAQQATEQEAAH